MMEVDFGALYDTYHATLRQYIYCRVSDNNLADDLAQEVFVKAIAATRNGTGAHGDVGAWLRRIAHNLIIDHYRANKRHKTVCLDDLSSFPDNHCPHTAFEKQYLRDKVRRALDKTSDSQRVVVTMRLEGYSFNEIAEAVNKPANTVRILQNRAFNAMYVDLQEFSAKLGRPSRDKSAALDAVLAVLRTSGPMTIRQLMEITGIKLNRLYTVLQSHRQMFAIVGETRATVPPAAIWGIRS